MSAAAPSAEARKPWAFIAHKDGYWAGVGSATMPAKDLKKFIGDFVVEGFAIKTVFDRDEYEREIGAMKFWHDSPEYKTKHPKVTGSAS